MLLSDGVLTARGKGEESKFVNLSPRHLQDLNTVNTLHTQHSYEEYVRAIEA